MASKSIWVDVFKPGFKQLGFAHADGAVPGLQLAVDVGLVYDIAIYHCQVTDADALTRNSPAKEPTPQTYQ